MKTPDLDRERSEKSRSMMEFLTLYNDNLPAAFPQATRAMLEEYCATHAEVFKVPGVWSLDVHRKKVMDWLKAPAPGRVMN